MNRREAIAVLASSAALLGTRKARADEIPEAFIGPLRVLNVAPRDHLIVKLAQGEVILVRLIFGEDGIDDSVIAEEMLSELGVMLRHARRTLRPGGSLRSSARHWLCQGLQYRRPCHGREMFL